MERSEMVTPDDLAYLRTQTLRAVVLCFTAALYLWCVVLFQTESRFGPLWWGPAILGVGLAVAIASQNRSPSSARVALVSGMVGAIFYNMWFVDVVATPYVLAVVVVLSSLLFTVKAVAWTTVLSAILVIAVSSVHWGYSPVSNEVVFPVLVVGAVGILSSLAVRSVYLALYWAWDRAMAAQQNEEALRDRQGQLGRALKALDEAYQRLERMNYDIAAARKVAEDARIVKQQFMANVSHELRTPLNVITAFSEMMYLSPRSYGGVSLPAVYRGDVREIYRSGKHLLQLIDDVLDLSQIEARQMTIRPELATLDDVIGEALDIMRRLVQDKGLDLHAELPANLPLVMIDRARVRQVMVNLLNNALRFTERGKITVRVVPEDEWMHVTVADTGIGIPAAEHEKAFEAFR